MKGFRIINGFKPKEERPWLVFIRMRPQEGAAGSILNKQYILTAAHVACHIPEFCR